MTKFSSVQIHFTGRPKSIPVGQLLFHQRNIAFEYSREFLATGLELSPFKLPLRAGLQTNKDLVFDGLFGLFNDSLPDGWGRLLLDRKLRRMGIPPESLTPLDRLCYVGKAGLGALTYLPAIKGVEPLHKTNLDKIAEEVYSFQECDDDRFVEELLALSSSSQGARPKILIQRQGVDWIVKFWSSSDPKDIGPIEYAYHLMAKEAGLIVPQAKLFSSKKQAGYFGVRRFDRTQSDRIHMHTLSGLIHADHRLPCVDYTTILKASAWLTKSTEACEQQFRAAVFNVLAHNRDDHAKNFSFLMNAEGIWSLSPAYDLTFSYGPAGEHCSTVAGEGKHPGKAHLLKLAETQAIPKQGAMHQIEEVMSATARWKSFAKEAGVSRSSSKMIETALEQVRKQF